MIKFFLVGIFCMTQPNLDCQRVASTMYYHTLEQCEVAAFNFDQVMKAKYPESKTQLHCVDAFPIPPNPDVSV